jgi:hypothetical protein
VGAPTPASASHCAIPTPLASLELRVSSAYRSRTSGQSSVSVRERHSGHFPPARNPALRVLIRWRELGAPPRNASSFSARALRDFSRARCVHDGRSFLFAALLETLLVPWSRCWSGRSLRASPFRSSPSSRCLIHAMHTDREGPAASMRAGPRSPARISFDPPPDARERIHARPKPGALHESSQAARLRGHEKNPPCLAEHGGTGSVFLARFVPCRPLSSKAQYLAMARKHSFRFRCSKQRLTPERCLAQCRASGTLRPIESLTAGPGRLFQQRRPRENRLEHR